MKKHYDVIVIGGGIIGLSCAYYLSKAGQKVIVLEKGEFGGGASGSCDDMILLQSKKPGIALEMAFTSLEMYRSLAFELDVDLEFQSLGGMILIESRDHLGIMEEYVDNQKKYGLEVEILNKSETRKRQPYVNESIIASTYSKIDSQVNPFRVMLGFIKKGKENGMEIAKQTEVKEINQFGNGTWQVVTNSGKTYESGILVNAAGAWALLIGNMVDIDIPIKPKRGQLIVTEQVPPLGDTNVWSAEYIVTKLKPELAQKRDEKLEGMGLGFSFTRTSDGNYFIGSTREYVGYDKGTTCEALEAISAQAVNFFPVLKDIHIIRSFGGLRPASSDGKAIVGEVPGRPGFFIAAGHEGDGIALAPITGKITSQLICGEKPVMDVQELSPARFL